MTKSKLLLIPALLLTSAIIAYSFQSRQTGNFFISLPATEIAAGAEGTVVLRAAVQGRRLRLETVRAAIVEGANRASVESIGLDSETLEVHIRPSIL